LRLHPELEHEAAIRSSLLKDGVSHISVDVSLVDGELLVSAALLSFAALRALTPVFPHQVGSVLSGLSPENTLSSMYIRTPLPTRSLHAAVSTRLPQRLY
jgi:hypothetical protein